MKNRKSHLPLRNSPLFTNPNRELVKANGRWVDREYFGPKDYEYNDFRLPSDKPAIHPYVQAIARLVRDDASYVSTRTSQSDANLKLDQRPLLPRLALKQNQMVNVVEANTDTNKSNPDEDKAAIVKELEETINELTKEAKQFNIDGNYRHSLRKPMTIQQKSHFYDVADLLEPLLNEVYFKLVDLITDFKKVENRIASIERRMTRILSYLKDLNQNFDVSSLLKTYEFLEIQVNDIKALARDHDTENTKDSAYSSQAPSPQPTPAPTTVASTVGEMISAAMKLAEAYIAAVHPMMEEELESPVVENVLPTAPAASSIPPRRILFEDSLPTPPPTPKLSRKGMATPEALPAPPAAKSSAACGPQ